MYRLWKDVPVDIWDWVIEPSPGAQAYEFWQHLFAKHHEKLAEMKDLKPAKIPSGWNAITKEMALVNLATIYNVDIEDMKAKERN